MSNVNVSRLEKTSAYTYEVTMIVQILAGSQEEADTQLEAQGGHMSTRKVKFLRSTVVYDSPLEANIDDAFVKITTEETEEIEDEA